MTPGFYKARASEHNVLMSRFPGLRRARSLSLADWLAVSQAWLVLLAADLGLRLLPFARIERLFTVRRASAEGTAGVRMDAVARCAWATSAAARRHLRPMRCLPRSFCLRWLLGRCGVSAQLRLGVAREESGLLAHAWVEVAGRPVGESEEGLARFARLGSMADYPGPRPFFEDVRGARSTAAATSGNRLKPEG